MEGGWLKDQWTCHVQEWSWVRAAGFANVRRVEGDQELIMSLRVFSSSKATSHFPVRMSEASLPSGWRCLDCCLWRGLGSGRGSLLRHCNCCMYIGIGQSCTEPSCVQC
jgi:hypothetical protein